MIYDSRSRKTSVVNKPEVQQVTEQSPAELKKHMLDMINR